MRFALDQNFPQPIIDALKDFILSAELVSLRAIDENLIKDTADWEVLLALAQRDWDGLITTDSGMLDNPKVLAVLLQTKLTLVVPMDAGHDPLLATGLLFAHLNHICANSRPDISQIWALRAGRGPFQKPWDRLQSLAKRRGKGVTAKELFDENKLPENALPPPRSGEPSS